MPGLIPFLVVLFLVAALLQVDFLFSIGYLLVIALVLTRLWTRYGAAHIEVARRLTLRAFPGEDVTVEMRVTNSGRLPLVWVDVKDSFPADLASPPFCREVMSLAPRETKRVRYVLTCRRRGAYRLGPFSVSTGDGLGLHPAIQVYIPPAAHKEDETLIVYPEVTPLEHLGLPARSPLAALPMRASFVEDPARVLGVQDYRAGDSLRRMHWTASARAGRWLIKRYEPVIARDTLVALDLTAESYERRYRFDTAEMAIRVAASIASHVVVREGLAAGLSVLGWDSPTETQYGFSLPPRRERAHLMALLEVLARVDVVDDDHDAAKAAADAGVPSPANAGEGTGGRFAQFLRQETAALPWGTTVAVVSGTATPALLDTLGHLRQRGLAVVLILARRAMTAQALLERARVLGIRLHHVWVDNDLGSLA